jgi:hypothetical protein
MHISAKIKTPPTVEPVAYQDLKTFARIDNNDENDFLTSLVVTAREFAEKYTNRAFITQTWEMAFDYWSNSGEAMCREYCCYGRDCHILNHFLSCTENRIELDRPPLQSVTQIRTLDNDGNVTVINASEYLLDLRAEPGVVSAITTPIGTRDLKAIEIEYIAGYGDTGASVPQGIKTAILAWATEIYRSRIPNAEPSENVANMLSHYKVYYL